jgi:hypothetical protein
MNEFSLHSEIKKVYAPPGEGKFSHRVQTKNFSALKEKLIALTEKRQVRLVYRLPEKKWITHVTKDHAVLNTRKSPRKGRLTDLFGELVMIPQMIGESQQNFNEPFVIERSNYFKVFDFFPISDVFSYN